MSLVLKRLEMAQMSKTKLHSKNTCVSFGCYELIQTKRFPVNIYLFKVNY